MNKFMLIAVVALAASQMVLAAPATEDIEPFSQAGVDGAEAETDLLMGNERLFTDYCRAQRSYIVADIQKSAHGAASQLFKQFFHSYNDISDEVLTVERDAVKQLAAQIENPDLPVYDSKISENEVAALIENGRAEIAKKNDRTFGLVPAMKAAASAMYNTLNSALFTRLGKARVLLEPQTFVDALKHQCTKVAEYEQHITQELEAAKSEIAASANPDIQNWVQTVSISSLHCQSTKNIVRLNAFCELLKSGGAPFMKMLGVSTKI